MGYTVTKSNERGLLALDFGSLVSSNILQSDNVEEQYEVDHVPISRGKFAAVKLARERKTGLAYILKYIRKRRRNAALEAEAKHEIAVLLLARNDPHIIHLHKIHQTKSEYIAVLEYARGGDLQQLLDEQNNFTELETRNILLQVLYGLQSLHNISIAHLDIKPQNIVMMGPLPEDGVKLVDFGLSRIIDPGMDLTQIMGTPDYVAPEVINFEPIGLYTDMWAIGVLCYVFLCGHTPFGGNSDQETFVNITQGYFDFPESLFLETSKIAMDFISTLIVKNTHGRVSIQEALQHPWITSPPSSEATWNGSQAPKVDIMGSPGNMIYEEPSNQRSIDCSPLGGTLDRHKRRSKVKNSNDRSNSALIEPALGMLCNSLAGPSISNSMPVLNQELVNARKDRADALDNNLDNHLSRVHNKSKKWKASTDSLPRRNETPSCSRTPDMSPQVNNRTHRTPYNGRDINIKNQQQLPNYMRNTINSAIYSRDNLSPLGTHHHLSSSMFELPTMQTTKRVEKSPRHSKNRAEPSHLKSLLRQRMEDLKLPEADLEIIEDEPEQNRYNNNSSMCSRSYNGPASPRLKSRFGQSTPNGLTNPDFGSTTSLIEPDFGRHSTNSRSPSPKIKNGKKMSDRNVSPLMRQAITSFSLMNLNQVDTFDDKKPSPNPMRMEAPSLEMLRGNSFHMSFRLKRKKKNKESSKYI